LTEDLAPEPQGKLDSVIELLRPHLQDHAVVIVGHNPQLERLGQKLSPSTVKLGRGDCCYLELNSLDKPEAVVRQMPPGRPQPARRLDRKDIIGLFFAILALATFLLGGLVLYRGLESVLTGGGEGSITINIKVVGEMKGVNGSLALIFLGIALILTTLGYVSKAYREARREEGGVKDTIRHMYPFA
jgi:hypothetical protein